MTNHKLNILVENRKVFVAYLMQFEEYMRTEEYKSISNQNRYLIRLGINAIKAILQNTDKQIEYLIKK